MRPRQPLRFVVEALLIIARGMRQDDAAPGVVVRRGTGAPRRARRHTAAPSGASDVRCALKRREHVNGRNLSKTLSLIAPFQDIAC